MPMHVIVNELLETGFVLDRLIEPTPMPALRDIEPEKYEALRAAPVFVALSLHV